MEMGIPVQLSVLTLKNIPRVSMSVSRGFLTREIGVIWLKTQPSTVGGVERGRYYILAMKVKVVNHKLVNRSKGAL